MFGWGVENLRRGSATTFGRLLKYLRGYRIEGVALFHFFAAR